jgi:ElaB/YqjD/DUF883 family membrane-anchored ribosome-binding protein
VIFSKSSTALACILFQKLEASWKPRDLFNSEQPPITYPMSETVSSEGTSEPAADPASKPKPQPFAQSIPQPRQTGDAPRRASSIYDESEPVVRSEAPETAAATPTVTGNAPERRPAENPFPTSAAETGRVSAKAATSKATPIARPAEPTAAAQPSSTLKAAEQLRAAAGEKARQLRQSAENQAQTAQAQIEAAKVKAQAQRQVPPTTEIPAALAAHSPAPVAAAPAQQPAQARPQPRPQASPAPTAAPVTAQQTLVNAAATAAAALSPSAQQTVDEWKAIAEASWADASIVLKDIQKEGERYVRENPTRAVITALGVGFVLGVFLKR